MSARGHAPTKFAAKTRIPWLYCARCGLMYLKNAVSQKAVKAPCPADAE